MSGLIDMLRWEMLLVPVPGALGYTMAAICDMPSSDGIPFRPPAWVFAVVWPILYLLFGIAWFRTAVGFGVLSFQSASFALTTVMLTLWSVVYSCRKKVKNAVFVLLASVLCASFNVALAAKPEQLMVIPLLVWLVFATLMNAFQTTLPAEKAAETDA